MRMCTCIVAFPDDAQSSTMWSEGCVWVWSALYTTATTPAAGSPVSAGPVVMYDQ